MKTLFIGLAITTIVLATGCQAKEPPTLLWSTKTGHRVRVFPVSVF
ncbi:Uncharacterised protein [Enterobacter hormaechei]|nr:Uncharacterised protein [Enterobacter hormaechei]